MPKRYAQLSASGQLHRMEAGHAGAGASNPMDMSLLTLSKYELCNLPNCFGTKGEIGGAIPKDEPKDDEVAGRLPRTRRISHGVRSAE